MTGEDGTIGMNKATKLSRTTIMLFAILDALVICITVLYVSSQSASCDSDWLYRYNGEIWFDHEISDEDTTFPAGKRFQVNMIMSRGEVSFTDPDTGIFISHKYYINDAANSLELHEAVKQMRLQDVRKGFIKCTIAGGICFLIGLFVYWLIDSEFGMVGNIVTFVVTLLLFWGIGSFFATYISKARAPVIYLYPKTETEVSVSLALNGRLTETYPLFNRKNGWTVTASPDGTLTDKNGNKYSFLYWEADLVIKPDLSRGFCVKGGDTKAFLETALKQLGLSDIESADFIGYWLPQLEGNKYNVITFQTTAYENAASMKVSPEPDTVIRVNMLWYPSKEKVNIRPQELGCINPAVRKGFTVVEWGGEEYKKGKFYLEPVA